MAAWGLTWLTLGEQHKLLLDLLYNTCKLHNKLNKLWPDCLTLSVSVVLYNCNEPVTF